MIYKRLMNDKEGFPGISTTWQRGGSMKIALTRIGKSKRTKRINGKPNEKDLKETP